MALPIIRTDAATDAVERLARDHAHLAHHIRELATLFLGRAVGLRDGSNAASCTYDLSFVGTQHSFACLTATPGKHDNATNGRLQVQVRYQGDRELTCFELKARTREVADGWHTAQLAADDDLAPLREDLLIALANRSPKP